MESHLTFNIPYLDVGLLAETTSCKEHADGGAVDRAEFRVR